MKKSVQCALCDETAVKTTHGRQKYCYACSVRVDSARKSRYTKNPLSKEEKLKRKKEKWAREDAIRVAAARDNIKNYRGLDWMADSEPSLIWVVRLSVPFSYEFSKNAQWAMGSRATVFLRKQAMERRKSLSAVIKASLEKEGVIPVPAKLWVDVLVQKTNHRGDAINVVDAVCDAMKDAIGLDDRWFSIRRLDWEIVKENPRIFVGFGQETAIHHTPCSYCGLVLASADNFPKRKHTKSGFGRVCFSCEKVEGQVRRDRRKMQKADPLWSLD